MREKGPKVQLGMNSQQRSPTSANRVDEKSADIPPVRLLANL